jgi:hypothetical protein
MLAFSLSKSPIYEIKYENNNNAMFYYYYSQSLAYGTQYAMKNYINSMLQDNNAAIEASKYANKMTYWYLNNSLNLLNKIAPNINLGDIKNIKINIISNGIRGNNSQFIILVYKKEKLLANLTAFIQEAEIIKTNSSINLYYRVVIYIKYFYIINDDFILYDHNFTFNILSQKGEVEFVENRHNDTVILTMDWNLKGKIVITIKNSMGIVSWLLA